MRDNSDLTGMGKTAFSSHYRAIKESLNGALYTDAQLVTEDRAGWIGENLKCLFKQRCKIPAADPDYNGIFTVEKDDEDAVTIALLSDWATYTPDAQLIAKQSGQQDYSIHLGDTYYIGILQEIVANFCPDLSPPAPWPYGSLGSFAMLGNHEMYSGGSAYFQTLLTWMGTFNTDGALKQRQQLSYFCLENKYWRIIALDTGYDSLTFKYLPNKKLDLSDEQKQWFQEQVNVNNANDKRGIIILSHHQCYSAFEGEFKKPMEFISNEMASFPRDILWIWGHEHRFAVYGKNQMPNGGNIFARCIGNSGMPVELDDDNGYVIKPKNIDPGTPEDCNLVLFDQRHRNTLPKGNVRLGYNGYAIMTLTGPSLLLQYFDDNCQRDEGRLILEETWTCDPGAGTISGTSIIDHTAVPGADYLQQLSLFTNNDITAAIS